MFKVTITFPVDPADLTPGVSAEELRAGFTSEFISEFSDYLGSGDSLDIQVEEV